MPYLVAAQPGGAARAIDGIPAPELPTFPQALLQLIYFIYSIEQKIGATSGDDHTAALRLKDRVVARILT